MDKITFPVKLELRIDWSELDIFGHVNNVMYFKYIQSARVNYWETLGMNKLFAEKRIAPILASVKCDFMKPLLYPGNLVINSRLDFIGNTSFGLHHRIFSESGEIASDSLDVLVWFDYSKNEKITFPPEYLEKLKELEGELPFRG